MAQKLPARTRTKLINRSDGCCEICGKRANNAHHRKNQSQCSIETRHRLSNLMLLCGSGTTGCHGYVTEHPMEARQNGWRVWRSENPLDQRVLYRGQWAKLDDEGNVHII